MNAFVPLFFSAQASPHVDEGLGPSHGSGIEKSYWLLNGNWSHTCHVVRWQTDVKIIQVVKYMRVIKYTMISHILMKVCILRLTNYFIGC